MEPETPVVVFTGVVEPVVWGDRTYTVLRVPDELAEAARAAGTHRVGGTVEDVEVDLALTRAPVVDGAFLWAGSSLLRRLGVAAGDPVEARLRPVDPDHVPVPEDLADALAAAGRRDAWDALTPGRRRGLLQPLATARTEATRARRVAALVEGLG